MPSRFKRVPAVDKCFEILESLVQSEEPLGISDISWKLNLNKSTVFGIVRTLVDLNVLESRLDGKYVLGPRLHVLGNTAWKRSGLIQTVRPCLERINRETDLSVFLGIRSDCRVILIDKVDSGSWMKLSSEIGMRMPVLAGAGIKAMLSLLPDEEIDEILARTELKRYTARSITDKALYKKEILKVREKGVAYDREEYIEGMVALAIPVKTHIESAIWVVGLTRQVRDSLSKTAKLLRGICEEIHTAGRQGI